MANWGPDSVIQIINHLALLVTSLTGLIVALAGLRKVKKVDKKVDHVTNIVNGKGDENAESNS